MKVTDHIGRARNEEGDDGLGTVEEQRGVVRGVVKSG
jgi:hypothetical protein